MTEKTGLFRRLEVFEKLVVAANAEASVAFAYLTEKERWEEFGCGVGVFRPSSSNTAKLTDGI